MKERIVYRRIALALAGLSVASPLMAQPALAAEEGLE